MRYCGVQGTTGGGCSAARSAAQFRLRQCNAMQVWSPSRLRQCNAMQVRSPNRLDRDYEYISMTWGIKITEFLVEMELFPQKQSGGKQLFDSHWLVISFTRVTSVQISLFIGTLTRYFTFTRMPSLVAVA